MTDAAVHESPTPPARDGRTSRADRTKARILTACRELMLAGNLRPSATEIGRRAGCSVRTVFEHYRDIERLHLEAIQDSATADAIAEAVCGGKYILPTGVPGRILRAVVLGRTEA